MRYINIDHEGKINDQEPFFANGTSLQGGIDISYKKLVKVFGEPNAKSDGYKTDAEWIVFTINGVATIYNYKNGRNYLGNEGLDVENITDWNIGGRTRDVIKWVKLALEK